MADGSETASAIEAARDDASRLSDIFEAQRRASRADPYPDEETRRDRLARLIELLERHEKCLVDAVSEDFGVRSPIETILADIIGPIGAARRAQRKLKSWMRPRRVSTPLYMKPGRSRVMPQPLGVVGVIAPWNYPISMVFSPAVGALAAGNAVLAKPSELTPATSEAMRELIAGAFDETEFAIVTGGRAVGEAFAALPFDHLFFTGSTAVGAKIAEAAARNLTPVTLELGGKSPAIVDHGADLDRTAQSIVYGKLLNGGQTCIAPDYVLAPADLVDPLLAAMERAARRYYPDINATGDYASIISARHFSRLQGLIEDAKARGARIIEIGDRETLAERRKIPFTIIVNPGREADVMREEIFGPALPVIAIGSTEDAIARVQSGERPLALYWFGEDDAAAERVLRETHAGGVTINDTLMHVAQERLPFGGVGKSGVGAYHGQAGFDRFSHLKSIFRQSRWSSQATRPPYTDKTKKTLGLLRRLI